MLTWIIAAVFGILFSIILIYKYTKTSKYDVLGYSMYCKICGGKINGLKCPKCVQKKDNWR
jgi:membrane protein CcdC involved in cytochrome C biogenesis